MPTTPIAGDFTLAAAGDLIYLRPMAATLAARSPEMLRLLRGAGVVKSLHDVIGDERHRWT